MPKQKKVHVTKEQVLNLTKKELQDLVKNTYVTDIAPVPNPNLHPTGEQRRALKNVSKEEFQRFARKCGHGAHIGLSRHWADRLVKVSIEEVKQEEND